MIIEVPCEYFDNIFFFYKIICIVKNKTKKITLFINTITCNINDNKLNFCCSILNHLGYNVNVIIDKKLPKYYELILLQSKITGEIEISNNHVVINNIIYDLECDIIRRLNYDYIYYSKSYAKDNNCNIFNLQIYDIDKIIKIATNNENIKELLSIIKLFNKNSDTYENNYYKLKMDIIDNLKKITVANVKDISNKFNMYPSLNEIVDFKEE